MRKYYVYVYIMRIRRFIDVVHSFTPLEYVFLMFGDYQASNRNL